MRRAEPRPDAADALRDAKRAKAETAQRRAARPDCSVWVAASAGTGKTKVLVDRVLSLLLHGTEPARILCLTFTKAAAAEMANRLAERLAGWAADPEADLVEEIAGLIERRPEAEMLSLARGLFAAVLDAPGGMKIQTIHAFCQSLLGRFPLEAGVAPHFQVLDERSAAEMLAAAREEVLSQGERPDAARLSAAVAEVTAHALEQGFDDLMGELTRERGRIDRLLADHGGLQGTVRALARVLGIAEGESREGVIAAACADEALDLMGLRLAVAGLEQGTKTDKTRARAIAAWLEEPARRAREFDSYLAVYFTKQGEGEVAKTLIHKDALAAAPGADRVLAAEAGRLAAVRDKLRALDVLRASASLLEIGAAILDAYRRHKRARALLDYDDLILTTRDLLRRPGVAEWVLFKLDGGLDHVLIDEAQDTSPDQWAVIAALTAEFFVGEGRRDYPRSVFAVGDAKQSIYGFQRAEPAAFAEMRAVFAKRAADARQRMEAVALDVSFRSTAAVLEAVDGVFAQPAAQDGLLLEGGRLAHDSLRVGQAGRVELWPPADPLEAEPPQAWSAPLEPAQPEASPAVETPPRSRLARLIARRIWHWTRAPAGAEDPESRLASKDRRLEPGDIMVLVRRRNLFVEELVRELKRLDVPVAGVDRMVLSDQLAVMDLVALGHCLLLPEDDLTLATVLKGPLIGLDEEQLFALAHGRDASLWQALKRQAGSVEAFGRAQDKLARLQARADYLRPYELYAELLGAGGGRAALLNRLGVDAGDPIEEFLSLALAYEREHVPSLQGFLHWLAAGGQEIKRDLEHGQDAVRVMTVHGAKGLQAPLVILPDTLQTPPATRGLLWLDPDADGRDEGQPLLLWPLRRAYDGAATARARAKAQRAQAEEYRRLLYVAMTRAEDRLYICGWNTQRAAPEDCWYRLVDEAMPDIDGAEARHFDFTAEVEGGWQGQGWRLERPQTAAPESVEAARPAPPATALPEWTLAPARPERAPPRPLAPSRPAEAEPPAASPLAADQGWRFRRGLIVHRLLQSLPDLPTAARRGAAERFLGRPLLELSPAARDEILEETMAVLEAPELAALFGPDSRAEVPIVGLVQGASDSDATAAEVVSGQVDRLVVGAEKVLIVDYKTNRTPPVVEADVPTLYVRQMALYRTVLHGIYPEHRIRCLLLWTDGPRLMQLSDAALARQAP